MKLTFPLPTTLSRAVALPGLCVILGLSTFCGLFPERAGVFLSLVQSFIFENLSWVYVLLFTLFILFLLVIALSRYGDIRLGSDYSQPKYSYFSWISMLFAAGMGVGLMFFGVAETVSHYSQPAIAGLDAIERAKYAQLFTFFHWGIHAWSVYAVVALALAYFRYRYKLPLAIRSTFYPIFREKIYGPVGDVIDVFALCSTFFGIATTLGFGVVQLNAGLAVIGAVPENSFTCQAAVVVLVMSMAVGSTLSGLNKGVKFLSELNILLAVGLMAFILILGPTRYILKTFSQGVGFYLSNLVSLTFNTFAYRPESQHWFTTWTILYWAWWISWSPFVGLFIARISKGRTIREFIIAVLVVPSLFNFLWMTTFGNSAVRLDSTTAHGALSALTDRAELMLFAFFDYFPFTGALNWLAVLMIGIFFVTSADSGILVMNSIASRGGRAPYKWQNVFWGTLLVLLSLAMLRSGGLAALQTVTLIAALPFGLLLLLLCFCLWKALRTDKIVHESDFAHGSGTWSGDHWPGRLRKILSFPRLRDIDDFLDNEVAEAFARLKAELEKNGILARVTREKSSTASSIELVVPYDGLKNFTYGVFAEPQPLPERLLREGNAPCAEEEQIYMPLTYFNDGRTGYDIYYMTRDEIIADVLREYERFISLVSDRKTELLIINSTNPALRQTETS